MLDATIQLIDGQVDSAGDTAILLFHLAGTLHDEPSIIGRLVQMNVENAALQAVEYTLRVDKLGVETLVELGRNVDDRLASSTLKWAILGERAALVGTCEDVAKGTITLTDLASGGPLQGYPVFDAIPLVVIRMNQRRMAEVFTWLVDACDDPKAMTEAVQRMESAEPTPRLSSFLVHMLLPSYSRAVELHVETVARLRCAAAGLAAERFRLDNDQFPDSIDVLVPQYLDAVPIDPFDQQPIRLAVNDDGIVIYSVGPDRVDDGGDVTAGEHGIRPPDRGFRLLEPQLRGLVTLDDSAESE